MKNIYSFSVLSWEEAKKGLNVISTKARELQKVNVDSKIDCWGIKNLCQITVIELFKRLI